MSRCINLIPYFSHSCVIFHSNGCKSLVIQKKILNVTAAFVLGQDATKPSQADGWSRNHEKSGTTCLGYLPRAPFRTAWL